MYKYIKLYCICLVNRKKKCSDLRRVLAYFLLRHSVYLRIIYIDKLNIFTIRNICLLVNVVIIRLESL